MKKKYFDLQLLAYIVFFAILITFTMESSISLYLTETYDPNYYLYQSILYGVAGIVTILNHHKLKRDGFNSIIWLFCGICFFSSIIRLNTMTTRGLISIFFNTCIIPFAIFNGQWFGNKLSFLKDRDFCLIFLQIPMLYAISLLRDYSATGDWFNADIAFCVIVFFPLVFFFKRSWLTILFSLIYIVFSLTSAKRSVLVFVAFCTVIYLLYLFFCEKKHSHNWLINKLFASALIILGSYYIFSNENSGLKHAIERTEALGGMTDDNGRIDIYSEVTYKILNSDTFSLLLGHGHMAVYNDLRIGAHNDMLEIGYDYGILAAFFFFAILMYYIIKAFKLLFNREYQSAMILGICISSIVILGMLNCIIISTILLFSMFFALGCGIGFKKV